MNPAPTVFNRLFPQPKSEQRDRVPAKLCVG